MPFKLPKGIDPQAPVDSMGFVAFDTETTGIPVDSRVVEVGIILYNSEGEIEDKWESLVNPTVPIPAGAARVHGIKEKDVKNAPKFPEIYDRLIESIKGRIPIAYNLPYDHQILKNEALRMDKKWFMFFGVDPLVMSRHLFPGLKDYKQETVTTELGVHGGDVDHRALADTERTANLFFMKMYKKLRNARSMTIQRFWDRQIELAFQHEDRMKIRRRGRPTNTPWYDLTKEIS